MATFETLLQIAGIGIGATVVMDMWLAVLQKFGAAILNFDLVGRWVGHLFHGQFRHRSIRESPRIPAERAWGWLTHYTVGIVFSGILVSVQGLPWMQSPTLWPAVAVGMATVVAPLFVMQPAMGYGWASSRTPTPFKNCLRSLANHAVFGFGLYVTARLIAAAT